MEVMMKRLFQRQEQKIDANFRSLREELGMRIEKIDSTVMDNEHAIDTERTERQKAIQSLQEE
eukprot:314827-Karenia_brevis.AAC.1